MQQEQDDTPVQQEQDNVPYVMVQPIEPEANEDEQEVYFHCFNILFSRF